MPKGLGDDLRFDWQFTTSNDGATGLTLLLDIYNPAGTKIIDAGSGAIIERVKGGYHYILDGATYNTSYGRYEAYAYTTGTADVKSIKQCVDVEEWVDRVRATIANSETATVVDIGDWLDALVTRLRNRMYDLAPSNYTTPEIKRAILETYLKIKMQSKCCKETIEISTTAGRIKRVILAPTAGGTNYTEGDILTVTTVGTLGTVQVVGVDSNGVVQGVRVYAAGSDYTTGAGKATSGGTGSGCTIEIAELWPVFTAETHTYDIGPIFEPLEVWIGDTPLSLLPLSGKGKKDSTWNNTPSGDPTELIQISGSKWRLYPTPDAGALGVIGTLAAAPTAAGTGYAEDETLTLTSGDGLAQARVLTITGGGATGPVGTVEIIDKKRGTGYAVGTGKATTSSGAGINCTLSITALAPLKITGCSKGTDMLRGSDRPTEIPDGYSAAILDGAAWEACNMRGYTGALRARAQEYNEKFGAWIEQIKNTVKGQ